MRIGFEVSRAKTANPEVSVVLPCLDEARTVGSCVREARRVLARNDIAGEVVVADNGSGDSSVRAARSAGARVIRVERKGYGAAVAGGVAAARGRVVIMADADLSYDFSAIPSLLAELRRGSDLVMGSRLRGTILRGAMPFSHRFIGTPFFNVLVRLLLGVRVSDSQTGMRAFPRRTFLSLGLRSTGMEFATEMLARSSHAGLKITEVPIRYRPAGRGRAPHLRAFPDGWRHLRLLLLLGPPSALFFPGVAMLAVGTTLMAVSLFHLRVFGHRADVHFAVFGSGLLIAGHQVAHLGVCALAVRRKAGAKGLVRLAMRVLSLEGVLVPAVFLALAGLGIDLGILVFWVTGGFPALSTTTTAMGIIGTTLILLAGGMILGGFFLGSLAGADLPPAFDRNPIRGPKRSARFPRSARARRSGVSSGVI